MSQLPETNLEDENVLVGFETGDDAGVYKLTDKVALVLTVDFFPPIVDDPYDYGVIAAANALSDVYAVGGTPLTALNIAGFPIDLPSSVIARILEGGAAKAAEAGVSIIGGHTIQDEEPKYGLAVVGTVEPGKNISNATARPGDVLVLTKALGTGVITTAAKTGQANNDVFAAAVRSMSLLNRGAAIAMREVGVNAATDVTGFGLLGHLQGMMQASGTSATINLESVPTLPGTRELLKIGIAPGGTHRNLDSLSKSLSWATTIDDNDKLLLCDAQTSGGMLISVDPNKVEGLQQVLISKGCLYASVVGEIKENDTGRVMIVESPPRCP